jgi:hypothetical protein
MTALYLDASLETLRPLCYRGTHRLQGVSAATFTRGLFRLPRLLRRFWQDITSKTAHNL